METDHILLVEDNEDDFELLRIVLEHAGIETPLHWVQTADAAIEYLSGEDGYAGSSHHPLPRLIFVDLKLPGKSGHEFLDWLNSRPELADIVRVVLTGSDDPQDRRMAGQLGASCYLIKPLTVEQLTNPSRSLRMFFASSGTPAATSA